ncbi:MAG: FHA domain-containing protein [Deltaproteobacteria bacterium]|nr:FHA domain-containing protein [Deltaproteobacteria bacterium]
MSVLQIYRGDDFLDEVVLSRAVYGLGRHPQNDIVLDDRSLSRFHARVERRGERFVVVDCGAQNGVHLNGQRIVGESDLAPDDRITLGRYVAVFRSKSAPARGPTPPENETRAPAKAGTKGSAKLEAKADAKLPKKNGKARPEPPAREPEPDIDVEVSLEGDEEPEEREDRTKKARPQKGDPTLVLLYNGMEVSRHPIGAAKLTVGRSKQCDVVIGLLGLSRKHAQIERRGRDVYVEDLGSQNGTWVNNQRIPNNKKLKHGDLLNFYDYAVLYLEDGNVEVGFHGASFTPPSDEHPLDDLSHKETGRGDPGAGKAAVRLHSMRGPAPIADSVASGKPAAGSQSELVDLGEGSFLGDEFEAASQDQEPSSLLDEEADDDAKKPGNTTDLIAQLEIGDSAADLDAEADRAFREAEEFAEEVGTEGELGKQSERTSTSAGSGGHAWPRDAELLKALSNAPDGSLVTVEVTLAGKPYTQLPLSQTVTRVGTDARCELSLPKSAGLLPWHLTLLHLGGAVVVYRAGRTAAISLAGTDIDMAVLKNGDLLDLGRVRLKIRMT